MAENEEEQPAGGGLVKKLAIYGGGGLLMVGIGLAAGWLIFGNAQPDPSEEIEEIIERKMQEREAADEMEADNGTPSKLSKATPEEEVFETIYHEFAGTFTTNLAGSRKMLQLGIGVSTQYDDTVMMNVDAHQLALRSIILGVISDFSEDQVRGGEGRELLADALRDAINAKLEELENFGGVEDVHFTSFVLQ
ncbi:MAG: flagellar basal body-associated FliL family protein [Alphaproteobacteria bacterium]|jgi:flagellar FliL protein|nr:flagellar biosynthesis protein FliL [Rhodospirillaceae bacterium]MBL6625099.1 flagellar basal body-associated FliL family protein [Alphaproteobacteria bacterium]MBL6671773.1 flagellar basal body-associated FliL family protein [Alphaproteobacteria bacterium]HAO57564.1 flagellar biosynthesis protein FliL [Alphaproteobacteria bacterium]HBP74160.1 flagellar biosynthesis protein FliL [Alphaproteobacteria bacterium]|tara:strand:+ start:167 stop:745 length:579 start_codon:yes stop_codon:yes gene_type:complete